MVQPQWLCRWTPTRGAYKEDSKADGELLGFSALHFPGWWFGSLLELGCLVFTDRIFRDTMHVARDVWPYLSRESLFVATKYIPMTQNKESRQIKTHFWTIFKSSFFSRPQTRPLSFRYTTYILSVFSRLQHHKQHYPSSESIASYRNQLQRTYYKSPLTGISS